MPCRAYVDMLVGAKRQPGVRGQLQADSQTFDVSVHECTTTSRVFFGARATGLSGSCRRSSSRRSRSSSLPLPDKTALASLVLATRYRAVDVIAGAWLAFFIHTIISVAAGGLLHALPSRPIHLAAGVGFIVFAVLALRRKETEELGEEARKVEGTRGILRAAWVTSFLVVFAAEWGDLTQLATAALVAREGFHPLEIGIGASSACGLWPCLQPRSARRPAGSYRLRC